MKRDSCNSTTNMTSIAEWYAVKQHSHIAFGVRIEDFLEFSFPNRRGYKRVFETCELSANDSEWGGEVSV